MLFSWLTVGVSLAQVCLGLQMVVLPPQVLSTGPSVSTGACKRMQNMMPHERSLEIQSGDPTVRDVFQKCFIPTNVGGKQTTASNNTMIATRTHLRQHPKECCAHLRNVDTVRGITEYYKDVGLGIFLPMECVSELSGIARSTSQTNTTQAQDDPLDRLYKELHHRNEAEKFKEKPFDVESWIRGVFPVNPWLSLAVTAALGKLPEGMEDLTEEKWAAIFSHYFDGTKDGPWAMGKGRSLCSNTPSEDWMALWELVYPVQLALPSSECRGTSPSGMEFNKRNSETGASSTGSSTMASKTVSLGRWFLLGLDEQCFIALPNDFQKRIMKGYMLGHLDRAEWIAMQLQEKGLLEKPPVTAASTNTTATNTTSAMPTLKMKEPSGSANGTASQPNLPSCSKTSGFGDLNSQREIQMSRNGGENQFMAGPGARQPYFDMNFQGEPRPMVLTVTEGLPDSIPSATPPIGDSSVQGNSTDATPTGLKHKIKGLFAKDDKPFMSKLEGIFKLPENNPAPPNSAPTGSPFIPGPANPSSPRDVSGVPSQFVMRKEDAVPGAARKLPPGLSGTNENAANPMPGMSGQQGIGSGSGSGPAPVTVTSMLAPIEPITTTVMLPAAMQPSNGIGMTSMWTDSQSDRIEHGFPAMVYGSSLLDVFVPGALTVTEEPQKTVTVTQAGPGQGCGNASGWDKQPSFFDRFKLPGKDSGSPGNPQGANDPQAGTTMAWSTSMDWEAPVPLTTTMVTTLLQQIVHVTPTIPAGVSNAAPVYLPLTTRYQERTISLIQAGVPGPRDAYAEYIDIQGRSLPQENSGQSAQQGLSGSPLEFQGTATAKLQLTRNREYSLKKIGPDTFLLTGQEATAVTSAAASFLLLLAFLFV